MVAAPKSKTKKIVAAALAAAMVATVAPAAALTAVGSGNGEAAGVEAAYAATTTEKLSAAAAAASSQTPYAATLAKDKVAGWDGTSKVEVLDKKSSSIANSIVYSDGTDDEGNFSADNGKTAKEIAKGCSGVSKDGVRWAFTGGKVENFEELGDGLVEGGTLYLDYDGAYDPYHWNDHSYGSSDAVVVDSTGHSNGLNVFAKNIVIGRHVTELAAFSMDGSRYSGAKTLAFEEPSSLVKVANSAFNIVNFEKITFPASLKEMEKNAIYGGGASDADITFKDPANTKVDPGAVYVPDGQEAAIADKKVGKVKKITAGKRTLTVSMKRVAGGKAYRVYYAVKGTDKYKSKLVKKLTKKNSTKSTVTYTIKGLKKGKQYKVHYIAYKKASAKKASAITRTTDKTSPKVK